MLRVDWKEIFLMRKPSFCCVQHAAPATRFDVDFLVTQKMIIGMAELSQLAYVFCMDSLAQRFRKHMLHICQRRHKI